VLEFPRLRAYSIYDYSTAHGRVFNTANLYDQPSSSIDITKGSLYTIPSQYTSSIPGHMRSETSIAHGCIASGLGPQFDPDKHMIFKDSPATLSMEDFGLANDVGISPVAATLPFALFSSEAIQIMRSEITKPEVKKGYHFSSDIANSQLRGYAREHAPFTYAAWNHPAVLAVVSKLAGIDVIPWSDYEIAHINLSVPPFHDATLTENDVPIVGWHTDSYPFVCVLMLSDCTNIIGGETALRTANGDTIYIRSPSEGYAMILQGRYITHRALRALDAKERTTAVTSWRPRSAFVKDDSTLRTVRPVSDLNELYPDFVEYRLDIIKQRVDHTQAAMRSSRQAGKRFDTLGLKAFLKESVDFLLRTHNELVVEDDSSEPAIRKNVNPPVTEQSSCRTGL
jgi:hypothetical protein